MTPSTPISRDELRKAMAKLFTDSHTPWPEMKPIEWPDTFADKAMQTFDSYIAQEVAKTMESKKSDLGECRHGVQGGCNECWSR